MKNTTTTATTATTANVYGITAFAIGETLAASDLDCGRLYLTAINNAKSAVRTIRDRVGATSYFNYFHNLDLLYGYAWIYCDKNGIISNFDTSLSYDVYDGISDCMSVLLEHIGETYTEDIRKQSRNRYGKSLDDKRRSDGALIVETIKAERETIETCYRLIYQDIQKRFKNKALTELINTVSLDDISMEIICRICDGDLQTDIANDLQISQQAVSKRFNKAVAKLREVANDDITAYIK